MGFRAALDLSEILSEYREFLGVGSVGVNFVDEKRRDERDPFEHDAIPRALYAQVHTRSEEPWRYGDGPATCSTCTDVVLARPTYAWDVNHWYRTVGVPWPYVNVSGSALSRAYLAAGGQESAQATYYFTRLLDRPTRAAYDAMALGEVFLDDVYVQDQMKAQAQQEASRRSATGTFTDAVSILDEWGYLLQEETVQNDLDAEQTSVQDEVTSDEDGPEPVGWAYAYWLWRSAGGTITRLEQWQALLVSALSVRGARVNLAVGFMGRQPQGFTVGRFDEHWIVFLDDKTEPTSAMAAKAAEALIYEIQKSDLI